MKHFDKIDWLEYKAGNLEENQMIEMEDHLYSCDTCMKTFLSTIEDLEIEEADAYIPSDFTDRLMEDIAYAKEKKSEGPKKKFGRDYFLYYAAVASVAVVLTAGGYFESLVDSVPKISESLEEGQGIIQASKVYDFTESITNKTSNFINNFDIKEKKEENHEKKK